MTSDGIVSEAVVEEAALSWLAECGYYVHVGRDVSPNAEIPLRLSYEEVLLGSVLRAALRRLNPHLDDEAIEHVIRVVSRPPHSVLDVNNRWFHELLMQGVPVEYRTPEGDLRG